jgi:general L-amino acid transport system substrate-binding protein
MGFTPVVVEDSAEARQNYDQGACDVYTTDRSGLAAQRAVLQDPDAHMLLPEIISKEPLGPLVRHGDNQWGDIARWTLNALITAEELGVTADNAASMTDSNNPEVRRLLGSEGDLGGMLGLEKDWAMNAISSVGNYGEIFERHIGPNTPVGLDRGLNALYKEGGILYSPPFR